MSDPYNLSRFLVAQEPVYAGVLEELERGSKTGHWIWYIFPQITGLGHSEISRRYSISSIDEARAYYEHSVLGSRLIECTGLVMAVEGKSAEQIFGYPDYLKFRSCLTLFAAATNAGSIFHEGLAKYFEGAPDPMTAKALGRN